MLTKILSRILIEERDSEIPADRLKFQKFLEWYIGVGEKLYELYPCDETKESIKDLRELKDKYKIYPKL